MNRRLPFLLRCSRAHISHRATSSMMSYNSHRSYMLPNDTHLHRTFHNNTTVASAGVEASTVATAETKDVDACGNLIFLKLVKSPFHQGEAVLHSVKALQLRKVNQVSVVRDTPTTRGLVYNCRHLLEAKIVPTRSIFPDDVPDKELMDNWEYVSRQERLRRDKEQKRLSQQRRVEKRFKHIEEKYAHFKTGEKRTEEEKEDVFA